MQLIPANHTVQDGEQNHTGPTCLTKMQAYRTCTAGGATSLNGLPKRRYTNISVFI